MAYPVSVNWKPETPAEKKAYHDKFIQIVAKDGAQLWKIACVLEKYLDASGALDEFWSGCIELRGAVGQMDNIHKKAKRRAQIYAYDQHNERAVRKRRTKKEKA